MSSGKKYAILYDGEGVDIDAEDSMEGALRAIQDDARSRVLNEEEITGHYTIVEGVEHQVKCIFSGVVLDDATPIPAPRTDGWFTH